MATMFGMASVNQVRGVLPEEAILMRLRASGISHGHDCSRRSNFVRGPARLNVWGRGGKHQIDAIADLRIGQPFSNPQRLLVEAKAYSNERKVGLPIVRGAVGVLKDVSEFGSRTDRINLRLHVTMTNLQSSPRQSLRATLRTMPSRTTSISFL